MTDSVMTVEKVLYKRRSGSGETSYSESFSMQYKCTIRPFGCGFCSCIKPFWTTVQTPDRQGDSHDTNDRTDASDNRNANFCHVLHIL